MEEEKLQEHLNMIRYFWEEKGDITRYYAFEELKPILQERYPALLKAWNDYKASIQLMDFVTKSL